MANILVNTLKGIGKIAAQSTINLALASLMNENDAKMLSGFKKNDLNFTKFEMKIILAAFNNRMYAKCRGKLNIKFDTCEFFKKEYLISKVELFKANEFEALKNNTGYKDGKQLFLILEKSIDGITSNASGRKRPPILQFLNNQFKLKLSLYLLDSTNFTGKNVNMKIGKDLMGKLNLYTLYETLNGVPISVLNNVVVDKKITDNDFINNNTLKTELDNFGSELHSLFDLEESNKSELEIVFNQAKAGRIESVNVFEKMKSNIIKLFKTKSKLIDTSKNTKIEILLQQPVTVEFKFSSENGPQDNRGFPMFSSIIIDFKQLKITGYYKNLGGNKNNITTFSSSIQYLKKLPKEFTNPNNNDFKLNEKFIMVLLLALKNSPQEFKDNMQLHF